MQETPLRETNEHVTLCTVLTTSQVLSVLRCNSRRTALPDFDKFIRTKRRLYCNSFIQAKYSLQSSQKRK